jgi:hypothetical protein
MAAGIPSRRGGRKRPTAGRESKYPDLKYDGPMRTSAATALGVMCCLCAAGVGGCLKRTISITSEPAGALVWLNDVEVGRTPTEVDFTYFGVYDVRLDLAGHEPIITQRDAKAPAHEYPGLDLFAEMYPGTIETVIRWHFDLAPSPESALAPEQVQEDLLARARRLRVQATGVGAGGWVSPVQAGGAETPTGEAGTPTTVDPAGTERTTTAPAPTTPP